MKVNLCCGMDYREGYLNVDNSSLGSDLTKIKVDLFHDIVGGLPWEDNSVDEIVFREALEHFNRHNGLFILQEIYRVLKPSGLLDLTVPPAERQLKMLVSKLNADPPIEDFFKAHTTFQYWKWVDDLFGATHRTWVDGKNLGDPDSHKCIYTKKTLSTILKYVGFNLESIDDNIWVKATK